MSNLQQTIKLQQFASDPNNSAWVFASAGSGKTKILVDRLLRLLLDNVKADKILCLTFTKVAAAEMQERINKELANWVLLDDANLLEKLSNLQGFSASNSDLKKARSLFVKIIDDESKIKIQTIHSFCQNLVKIFPFEAGIKPNFTIIETIEEKLLLQKAQKHIINKAQNNEYLRNLITKINAFLAEDIFNSLVTELLNKKEYLEYLKERFFGIEGLIEDIFAKVLVNKNSNEEEIFQEFLQEINQTEILQFVKKLEETALKANLKIADDIKKFISQPILTNIEFYQHAFFTQENEPRKIAGKVLEDELFYKIFNHQIDLLNEFFDRLNSYKICNSTALLLKFVDQVLEEYNQIKKQNALLDYNDLITKANQLLENPEHFNWVKLKLDGFFDHILIDESQDTNHQQWNIIKALTDDFFSGQSLVNKNRTIFIVGDEKQSIYGFQGAEANISQEIFTYFNEKLKDNPTKLHKVSLNNSFRSLSAILKAVDLTFSGQKEKTAITKISDFTGHQAIRNGIGRVEIWPQIKNKKAEKKENDFAWHINFLAQDKYEEKDFLAELISLRIKNLVENGHILEGYNKKVSYSDFMILLRNRTDGLDKSLIKFFSKYEIPYNSESKTNFAENIIIQDLIAAAKFALFPYDDLNLAALLKSPIFNLDDENLLEICVIKNEKSISLFEAIKFSNSYKKEQIFLERIFDNAQQLNCFEFFNNLLEEKYSQITIRNSFISRFGIEADQILDKFLLKTYDFYQKFSANLHKFLDFIIKLNPEISLSASKKNAVFISTIHSSKGLQAPIVFLPDCCFNFNKLPAASEKISWIKFMDEKLPIWCPKKDNENKIVKKHRSLQKKAAYDEYLRLLYVAMTRAENILIISGFGNDDSENSWYNLIKTTNFNESQKQSFFTNEFVTLQNNKFEVDDENLVIGQQNFNFDAKEEKSVKTLITKLPEFLSFAEQNTTKQFLKASSDFGNQITKSQNKGKLIHKIFEIIGKNFQEDKSWLIKLCQQIIKNDPNLSPTEKTKICNQVIELFESKLLKNLFSNQLKCELAIAGIVNGNIINARIDLVVIKNDEILIIDYKSDKEKSKSHIKTYQEQLEIYKKLISQIYPIHRIKTAILWTEFLQLEEVN